MGRKTFRLKTPRSKEIAVQGTTDAGRRFPSPQPSRHRKQLDGDRLKNELFPCDSDSKVGIYRLIDLLHATSWLTHSPCCCFRHVTLTIFPLLCTVYYTRSLYTSFIQRTNQSVFGRIIAALICTHMRAGHIFVFIWQGEKPFDE